MPDPSRLEVSGPVLFARYAFPPNLHGYCGPADHDEFFSSGAAKDQRGLRAMAQQFAGAWPYLQLIAGATGLTDPLDARVVQAYWVGSPRLDRVGAAATGNSMQERFRRLAGPQFGDITEGVLAGGVPHHSFAVFCVYPFTSLLSNASKAEYALTVLDRCRIRWGRVRSVHGDHVVVDSQPLTWDGRRLDFGPTKTETVVQARAGVGIAGPLEVGDWVSLHWEWVCERLTNGQVAQLRHYTRRHLAIVNNADRGPLVAPILG